jgi:hypothetical protein
MSHAVKACPNCGSHRLSDNNGTDSHMLGHGTHAAIHGGMHHHPVLLTLGLIGLAARALNPRKFTCMNCDHVFKA